MAQKVACRILSRSMRATSAMPIPTCALAMIGSKSASRLRGAELLGIVEAFGDACRIEDDGSGDDRAGPGTAAGFIDAADRRQTPRHRVLLESEMGA